MLYWYNSECCQGFITCFISLLWNACLQGKWWTRVTHCLSSNCKIIEWDNYYHYFSLFLRSGETSDNKERRGAIQQDFTGHTFHCCSSSLQESNYVKEATSMSEVGYCCTNWQQVTGGKIHKGMGQHWWPLKVLKGGEMSFYFGCMDYFQMSC